VTPGGYPDLPTLRSPEEPEEAQEVGTDERCSSCRYYRSDGRCQRFPPHGKEWSQVADTDYCGEYEAGEKHEAPENPQEEVIEADIQ
jgi:hypothetical protein